MASPIHKLISEAQSAFPDSPIVDVLDACEAFYMNGCADEVIGDVDTIGHFYRVDRFIVATDSQGFHTCHTFETVEEASAEMARLSALEDDDEEERSYIYRGIE